MRCILYTLLFSLIYVIAHAQIVINEIMYNPPESGIDSLEHIELGNLGVEEYIYPGMYFLIVNTDEGTATKALIIQRE